MIINPTDENYFQNLREKIINLYNLNASINVSTSTFEPYKTAAKSVTNLIQDPIDEDTKVADDLDFDTELDFNREDAAKPQKASANTQDDFLDTLYENANEKFTFIKKKLYQGGKKYTGEYENKMYKNGSLFTGVMDGIRYKKGEKFTGKYLLKTYKDGKVVENEKTNFTSTLLTNIKEKLTAIREKYSNTNGAKLKTNGYISKLLANLNKITTIGKKYTNVKAKG